MYSFLSLSSIHCITALCYVMHLYTSQDVYITSFQIQRSNPNIGGAPTPSSLSYCNGRALTSSDCYSMDGGKCNRRNAVHYATRRGGDSSLTYNIWLKNNKVEHSIAGITNLLFKIFAEIQKMVEGSTSDLFKRIEDMCVTQLKPFVSQLSIRSDGSQSSFVLNGEGAAAVLSFQDGDDAKFPKFVKSTFGVWLSDTVEGRKGRDMVLGGLAGISPIEVDVQMAMKDVEGSHNFQKVGDRLDELYVHRGSVLDRGSVEEGNEFVWDQSGSAEWVRETEKLGGKVVGSEGVVGDVEKWIQKEVDGAVYGEISEGRVLHEFAPIAYLINKLGGKSTDGMQSLLDVKLTTNNDRVIGPVYYGTAAWVDAAQQIVDVGSSKDSMSKGEDGVELILSNPRGFCEGVKRAIDTVEEALRIWGKPIYVKHEIVHNEVVVNKLKEKGAIFIEDVADVPRKSILVYSAHGIPPEVRLQAKERELYEVDATCPLVTKVHVYVKKKAEEGYNIILIGHKKHVEVIGTAGEAPGRVTVVETPSDVEKLQFTQSDRLFYATQTTLSLDDCAEIVDALKKKYPNVESIPSGSVCYATTNRQMALRQVVPTADVTFVVGSKMSSNALRLVETSERRGTKGYLVNHPDDVKVDMLKGVKTIALTSSASTPEETVNSVMQRLKEMGVSVIQEDGGVFERLPNWKLPRNLKLAVAAHDSASSTTSSSE